MQGTSDEWTTITRKSGKKAAAPTRLPPPSKDHDVARVLADFERKSRVWKASTCRHRIFEILQKQTPDGGWPVHKAYCLGSGSFSRDNVLLRQRSMLQFVAFTDILDSVRSLGVNGTEGGDGGGIKVYAQEPIYTEVDKEFLGSLAVDCVDPPQAEREVGKSMFVFAPFVESKGPTTSAIEAAGPCLYVGLNLRAQDEHRYGSYRLPEFEEDPNVFEGLVVRWQLPEDGD
ncbi:hypothetical protein K431DRAFT_281192 [Polychaeton citri CBS 116435]|uniref:SRR1-like domain-containing protein n=1 Tax=Polychaeton citri CBS 116435 TaxID=1314669 RepID=A0A9P4QGN0_9PEZI|nr:hypothetical protein K431DRAFT_281192 [Polychaeton citri CBS 116435]